MLGGDVKFLGCWTNRTNVSISKSTFYGHVYSRLGYMCTYSVHTIPLDIYSKERFGINQPISLLLQAC